MNYTSIDTWRFLKELDILANEEAFAIKYFNFEYLKNLQPIKDELITSLVNSSVKHNIHQSNNNDFKTKVTILIEKLEANAAAIDQLTANQEKLQIEKKSYLQKLNQFKGTYSGASSSGSNIYLNA